MIVLRLNSSKIENTKDLHAASLRAQQDLYSNFYTQSIHSPAPKNWNSKSFILGGAIPAQFIFVQKSALLAQKIKIKNEYNAKKK